MPISSPGQRIAVLGEKPFAIRDLPGLALWMRGDKGTVSDGAAQFTAANSEYLSIADNASLSTGDVDFWIAAWVYLDTHSGVNTIISKNNANTQCEYELIAEIGPNRFLFRVYSTGATSPSGVTYSNVFGIPTTGAWHFVFAWHDAVSNTLNIAVNAGAVDSVVHSVGVFDGTTAVNIGRGSFGSNYFDGRMDSLMFGKSPPTGIAATVAEIRAFLYNGGVGRTCAEVTAQQRIDWGAVSGYDFDEQSGTRQDSFGTNHLTDNNTVTSAVGVAQGPAAVPSVGAAAQFTAGNNESLSIASNASLQMGDIAMTFAGWLYFDTWVANRTFAGKTNATSEYFFSTTGGDSFIWSVKDNGAVHSVNNIRNGFVPGRWYFVCGYHDPVADTVGFSINGDAFVTVAYTWGIASTDNNPFKLLVGDGGKLDSWGLWKRVLTDADKNWLYNAGAGRVYADLDAAMKTSMVSWWDLDVESGQRNDSHGTNHLTDNNTVTQAPSAITRPVVTRQWQDQKGANHVTQATVNLKPLLAQVTNNGKTFNVLRFDGVDDCLRNSTISERLPCWFVISFRSLITMVNGAHILSDNSIGVFALRGTNGTTIRMYNGTNGAIPSIIPTDWNVYFIYVNQASSHYKVNSGARLAFDTGVVGAPSGLTLGCYIDGTVPTNIEVESFAFGNGNLSPRDELRLMQEFGKRIGLRIS